MANLNLPDLPSSPMFIGEENRIMTIEWQEFFRVLYERAGGITSSTTIEIDTSGYAELYKTSSSELVKKINDLEKLIISLASKSYDKIIKELEKKLLVSPSFARKILIPVPLDYFDAVPARASTSEWHGGIISLATAQPLDSVPTDIVVTKGTGKLIVIVNAGTDIDGEITVTGTSVDRNTGATTPADTDTLTVDTLSTDGSAADSNGNIIYSFSDAYITSKWFTGSVTLSTTDLTLTDVDVYHVSFEQINDNKEFILRTFDANIYTTNVAAEFDAYLYSLIVSGDKCVIHNEAALNVGANGETAIADKYWRLRKGHIQRHLDGLKDGFWVNVHYANSPVYVEDVTISVWLDKIVYVD